MSRDTYQMLLDRAHRGDADAREPLAREAQRRGDRAGLFASALLRAPSEDSWRRICVLASNLEPHTREESLRLAQRRLRGWPSRLRTVPPVWYRGLIEGRPQYAMRLARVLRIIEPITDEDLARVVAAPEVSGLRHLMLRDVPIGAAGAGALAESPHLARLLRLSFERCPIRAEVAAALTRRPQLEALRQLDLRHAELRHDGMRALTGGQGRLLEQLEALDLSHNILPGDAIAALTHNRRPLPRLSRLVLRDVRLGPRGAYRVWTRPERFPALTWLDLSQNALEDYGVEPLLGEVSHPRLRALEVAHNTLGHDACVGLLRAPLMRTLTLLDLGANALDDATAAELAASPACKALVDLRLAGNTISDDGAAALTRSRHLPHLTHLDLSRNAISDDGVDALLRGPIAEQLEHLDLRTNDITSRGRHLLERFAQRAGCRVLLS